MIAYCMQHGDTKARGKLRSVANSNENESHCQDRRSQTRIA
jgi:hypothetical protein